VNNRASKTKVCARDDVDDLNEGWRRLSGVTFLHGIDLVTDKKGKRTYDAGFKVEHGKME
jgi:hypothetical protein